MSPSSGDREATEYRTAAWQAGLAMFQSQPITGVGPGNFRPLFSSFNSTSGTPSQVAHNTYIEVAAELGLPGVLLFIAMLMSVLRHLSSVRRSAASRLDPSLLHIARGLELGLVAFITAAFFVSAQYQKLFWLLISLAAVLPVGGIQPLPPLQNNASLVPIATVRNHRTC
jgi:O-antigen ligase